MSYHVATFYKFTELHDAESLQQDLKMRCTEHHIKGTILLATEGLNATTPGNDTTSNEFWRSSKPTAASTV